MATPRSSLRRAPTSRNSSSRSPRQAFGLKLEQLEDRTLLAQSALAKPLVDGLYQALLGRMPQGGEADGWSGALQGGTLSPGQVAAGMLGSPEYDTRMVLQAYTKLLARDPEAGAVAHWLGPILAVDSDVPLLVGVLSSPEYFAKHGGDAGPWASAVYSDILDGLRTRRVASTGPGYSMPAAPTPRWPRASSTVTKRMRWRRPMPTTCCSAALRKAPASTPGRPVSTAA